MDGLILGCRFEKNDHSFSGIRNYLVTKLYDELKSGSTDLRSLRTTLSYHHRTLEAKYSTFEHNTGCDFEYADCILVNFIISNQLTYFIDFNINTVSIGTCGENQNALVLKDIDTIPISTGSIPEDFEFQYGLVNDISLLHKGELYMLAYIASKIPNRNEQ